jgi:hypothetical protein
MAINNFKPAGNFHRGTPKKTKLAAACILGETDAPLDATAIRKVVEATVGIFYPVSVHLAKDRTIRIEIASEDEVLEQNGLMQLSIFNVLQALCLEFRIRILKVEHEFLPDYA